MGWTRHNPQVVHRGQRFQFSSLLLHKGTHFIGMRVICHNGIVVNGCDKAFLTQKILLNRINRVMAGQHIGVGRHLNMKACQPVAGTVIVQHQIMNAKHARVAEYLALDTINQRRVRRCAKDRIKRIPYKPKTAIQDKNSHR